MLTGIPDDKAAGLVLTFVVLGGCVHAFERLRRTDPVAADEFQTQVRASTSGASAVEAAELLRGFGVDLRDRLDRLADPSPDSQRFLDVVDHRITDYTNDPYDPFNRVAEAAIAVTAQLYQSCGLTADKLRRAVPPRLKWYNDPPSPYRFARGVTGKTLIQPDGTACVELRISPRCFDTDCVLALPYILMHEYVCHAARAALGSPSPTWNTSPFTEGWMDCVALQVHDTVVESAAGSDRWWPDSAGCKACAHRLHQVRHEFDPYGGSVANGRTQGRDAAERVDSLFPAAGQRAGPLVPVSVCLNGSEFSDTILDGFVLAVDLLLDWQPNEPRLRRLFDDVIEGAGSRDCASRARRLVDGVHRIA